MEAPLARPGEVIRKLRGSLEEHLGALPNDPQRQEPAHKPKAPSRPPSRAVLEAAEQALADAETAYTDRLAELKRREEALADERRGLEEAQAKACASLEKAVEKERQAYDRAVARWQG